MPEVDLWELPSHVGCDVGTSEWFQITQRDVKAFADLTYDHEWIHVDVDRANREFGGTIAHGYHTLSLIIGLAPGDMRITGVRNGLNYGINKLRFLSMVRVGKRIRQHRKLIGAEPKAGGMLATYLCTMEIEGEERPAMTAEVLLLLFGEDQTGRTSTTTA
jgi:acyl dehydratase